jgi:molecular chaperone GrpE (heat shock protein)
MRDEVNPDSSIPFSSPGTGPVEPGSSAAETEPSAHAADAPHRPSAFETSNQAESDCNGVEKFDPTSAPAQPELTGWKDQLRREFEGWLDDIEEIPPAPDDLNAVDQPDLHSFYEELASLSTESRKANRRTAEAISQWNEVLQHFQGDFTQLRRLFTERFGPEAETLPRAHSLALLDLLDRVERMAEAFNRPPKPAWWSRDRPWRTAWGAQRSALDILQSHLLALLKKEGIERIATRGATFDPGTMTAVAAEPRANLPPQTVLEECIPGYVCRGVVLRLAQVKVSTSPPDTL